MPSASNVMEPAERQISAELEEQLKSYRDEWVVILGDRIVSRGATPSEALEGAPDSQDRVLHRVPDDGHVAYFF